MSWPTPTLLDATGSPSVTGNRGHAGRWQWRERDAPFAGSSRAYTQVAVQQAQAPRRAQNEEPQDECYCH